ncbi:MAG: hypothetical protein F6J94_12925 [Moorea sp. SIO1F2]|uniref:hypothetical protein n=1 Tax=Moorena sp. SIO1F2 TaxID=2607819 RepID=UPI0013BCBD92|nr:hypothetical protein [Moorena sp. SIO1F2]NET82791.1 hypothetical protein [Moorena sp. SIO1F2]
MLPSYSPELNRIEKEWQRLKEDELAGQMFEDEYEARSRCNGRYSDETKSEWIGGQKI